MGDGGPGMPGGCDEPNREMSDFDYLNDKTTQNRVAMWREVTDLRDRVRDNRALVEELKRRVAELETAAQRDCSCAYMEERIELLVQDLGNSRIVELDIENNEL